MPKVIIQMSNAEVLSLQITNKLNLECEMNENIFSSCINALREIYTDNFKVMTPTRRFSYEDHDKIFQMFQEELLNSRFENIEIKSENNSIYKKLCFNNTVVGLPII